MLIWSYVIRYLLGIYLISQSLKKEKSKHPYLIPIGKWDPKACYDFNISRDFRSWADLAEQAFARRAE